MRKQWVGRGGEGGGRCYRDLAAPAGKRGGKKGRPGCVSDTLHHLVLAGAVDGGGLAECWRPGSRSSTTGLSRALN